MEWDEDLRYRFRGQFVEDGDNKLMLFELDEPEMIKVEEIVLPPKENTEDAEGETVKKRFTFSRQNGQVLLESRSQVLHRSGFYSRRITLETGTYSGRQQR